MSRIRPEVVDSGPRNRLAASDALVREEPDEEEEEEDEEEDDDEGENEDGRNSDGYSE